MRDKTYLLFQRCYLVTLGMIVATIVTGIVLFKLYVTVSPVPQWQWIFAVLIALFAVVLAGIGIFGKPGFVQSATDPFGTGDTFEFLVIGIGFPLFGIVWVFRKIFVRA